MMAQTHRRGRFRYLFTGSLILVSLFLTSCSLGNMNVTTTNNNLASGNGGKDCMRVGILLPDTTSSTRWEDNDHPTLIKVIGAAIPGVHIDYNNAQGNSVTQFNQAVDDLAAGDCMLVVAPHDSVVAANIVAKAKAQNVPVIAYDRLIQSKDLSYYVSFDNPQVGVLQAEYIRSHYLEYMKPGQTAANMVVISGSQTDTNALLFSIGAHSILDTMLAKHELNNIKETFTPDWNNSTAQTEVETVLSEGSIQIAYVANDGMAGSVITALKAAGYGKSQVLVTGQDATAAGINNILAGYQSMTVYKPIVKEAQSVGDLVKAIHDGTTTQSLTAGKVTPTYDNGNIPSILDTPISVDSTNIENVIIKPGYLTRQAICTGIAPNTDNVC